MRRLALTLLLALACLLPAFGKGGQKTVLFIGNSYTFVNDLPRAFEVLANVGGCEVSIDSYTKGAATLHEFLTAPEHAACRERITKGGYDYLVLQDQSQTPYLMPERTLQAGEQWCRMAQKAGATPVLFITWAHAHKDKKGHWQAIPGMQEGTTTTYCRLAEATGAKASPVGEAWRRWYKKHPGTPLHSSDGSHPNALGTYLAACVLYATICREKPTELPARLQGLRIPSKQVREAQKVAEATVRNFTPAKYLAARAAADAKLPSLEELMPLLQKGATMQPLLDKLGEPQSREGDTLCYPLRGSCQLNLTPGKGGRVKQAIYIESDGRPNAVLLQP